jgi:hypothetical protein
LGNFVGGRSKQCAQAEKLWVFLSKKNEPYKISLLISKLQAGNFSAVMSGCYGVVLGRGVGETKTGKHDWVNDPVSLV